jgi:hypothetical protein
MQLIEKLRRKLKNNGQSLKWWHRKFAANNCSYQYFIIQLNTPEAMQDQLEKIIKDYLED